MWISSVRLSCLLLSSFSIIIQNVGSSSSGSTIEKVLILSDIHYDSLYESTLSSDCECNTQYDVSQSCSDKSLLNLYGQYGCDSPWSLVESSISNAYKFVPNPEFILFLGDYVRHDAMSSEDVFIDMKKVTKLIDLYFNEIISDNENNNENIQLLESSFGNADMYPEYQIETDLESAPEYLKRISSVWGKTGKQLTSQMNETVKTGGYFYTEIKSGLYIISINTIIYAEKGISSYNDDDPLNQFEWLSNTLSNINEMGDKSVWIIGHIAPSISSVNSNMLWKNKYIEQYYNILSLYQEIIKAQFYGHLHTDEFRVVTFPSTSSSSSSSSSKKKESSTTDVVWMDQASSPIFLVGAISPVFDSNPNFREVWYDSETFEVVDWVVYSTTLSSTNSMTNADLVWSQLYQFSDTYKLESLNNSEFKKMALQMLYDNELFNKYFTNFHANCFDDGITADNGDCMASCDTDCRKIQICSLLHGTTNDVFTRCLSCDAFHFINNDNDDDDEQVDDMLLNVSLVEKYQVYMDYLSDPSGCSIEGYLENGNNNDDDYDIWWDDWWWGTKKQHKNSTKSINIKILLIILVMMIFIVSFWYGIKSYKNRNSRLERMSYLYNEEKQQSWSNRLLYNNENRSSDVPQQQNETSSLLSNSNPMLSSTTSTSNYSNMMEDESESEHELFI